MSADLDVLSRDCSTLAKRKDSRLPIKGMVDCGKAYRAVEMSLVAEARRLSDIVDEGAASSLPSAIKMFDGIVAVLEAAGLSHGRLVASNVLIDAQLKIFVVGWEKSRLQGLVATPQDDVRALARILLSLLAGRSLGARDPFPVLPLPEALLDVCRKAESGSYANTARFSQALHDVLPRTDDDLVEPPSRPPVVSDPPRDRTVRNTAVVVLAVAVVVAASLLTGFLPAVWHRFRPPPWTIAITDVHDPVGLALDGSAVRGLVTDFSAGTVSVLANGPQPPQTITVRGHPVAAIADPNRPRIYISTQDEDALQVVDTTTNRVIGSVQVPGAPLGIALGPKGTVYVAASGAHAVAVVDPSMDDVAPEIPVKGNPVAVVTVPDRSLAYVVTHQPSMIVTIDTRSNHVVGEMRLTPGFSPEHAVARNGKVYLSDPAFDVIVVADPALEQVAMPLPVGGGSVRGLASTPDGRLYVAARHPNRIVVIDPQSSGSPPMLVPCPLREDQAPEEIALKPDGGLLVTVPSRDMIVTCGPDGR